jgi:acetyltransferase-like isoleucine patch superfamily enzyme
MPATVSAKTFRQREFDYCPWSFTAASTAEKKAQARYQKKLAAAMKVKVGERCFISPEAAIIGRAGCHLQLGDDCYIAAQAYITGQVRLGSHCSINPFATLRENIIGGNDIRIGAYACMVGANHGFADTEIPIRKQPHTSKGIRLGDDIWIGSHVMIVDGVTVGSHSILAAGAVVTKDVPPYAIVGGNPARVIRMRKQPKAASGSLESLLETFGAKAWNQSEALLKRYQARTKAGEICYVDKPGEKRRVRPNCDAVEIAAMFGGIAPGYTKAEWITSLREFQNRQSGLVPEHLADDRQHDAPPAACPEQERYYNTMIVNYALESLGSTLPYPVRAVAEITEKRLLKHLAGLPWKQRAWHAGDWIDCYASSLYPNRRYFQQNILIEPLMRWLDRHCDPKTGLWGSRTRESRWLQPVNGFYRLTRGTYAQFGRPLPYPERSIDSILRHAGDKEFFGDGRSVPGNACNVLDVVHPLWLCLKQTSHRRAEAEAWVARRLPVVLDCWIKGRGFSFDLAKKEPGLQGTEMWLSIVYLMADILGKAGSLGYVPRGVHRLEAVGK